jgi:hypothetical protein
MNNVCLENIKYSNREAPCISMAGPNCLSDAVDAMILLT